MKRFKRLTAAILGLIFMSGILPVQYVSADNTLHTLSDGSISVTVSGENGGFAIRTEEGDKLIKSDNNKELLFHRDAYDTSFTSFKITNQDGEVKEYLFGGSYGFMGLSSSDVKTKKDPAGITSEWTVDNLTFTQRIELAGEGAADHGMVLITYRVTSSDSTPVQVRARLLMDTALGEQDYACYEVSDQYGEYRSIERETVISDYIPANFFGYDNVMSPEITAYTLTTTKPYEIAFAHWNNLASALFDFTPDMELNFTNPYNPDYLTADSAVGLYYDLGTVSAAKEGNLTTCYGVYSNKKVTDGESIAINVVAPDEMTLSADRKTYEPEDNLPGDATFSIQAQINNFASDTTKVYSSVAVAAYVPNGIEPLNEDGTPLDTTPSYLNPYTVEYKDFQVGQTQSTRFLFKANVGDITEFRKVELRAFNITDWDGGALTSDRVIGSRSVYVLCPGGDGKLPEILFTGMKPEIIYNEGQRNLYISGKNFNLLEDKSKYVLRAYNKSDSSIFYNIKGEQISFSEGTEGNILNIVLSETMKTGSYELVFDWNGDPPSGLNKRMSAPALQFVVSDDKQYKNDYYGILAVVQNGSGGGSTYDICMYRTENEFQQDAGNHTEVLLVFKGGFEKTNENGTDVYKATSVKSPGGKAEDTVVINDCIDFENGNVTVRRENSSVLVDFDGDLYTSVKRSKIWSGKATFTSLDDGVEYGLIPYNSDGERMEGEHGQEITLLWPCGLSLAQTISGMAFNMTFGAMGIIYDTNAVKLNPGNSNTTPVKGRVVSFSACLDLSFLAPKAGYSAKDNNWASIEMAFSSGSLSAGDLRDRWKGVDMLNHRYNGTSYMDKRAKEGQGSVMVQDILYGCGKGLIGVNFDVNLVLPGYFDAMPSLAGRLAVNTIGGFEIGVDGSCQFATLEIETSIRLKDHNGIPVPDKLYFYIAGFEPGINVDGFGVLWITGGGGGIDKLYDTIFAGSSVPPLKILLSVSFDILKTLSARVDLSLSLRGLGLTARNVKVKYLDVPVLDKLALNFEWYPDFYFQASVDANILNVIRGQGYIVIMNNEQYDSFVEFFISGRVKIPDDILIVGGMELSGIDLGANNEKIWGKVDALSASFGVTYYWGGSVDFGSGSSVTKPSFPSLLGFDDIPVYYDEISGQTLYMRAGTNLSLAAKAQVVSEFVSTEPVLLETNRTVQSNIERTYHTLTLGSHNKTDAAITIQFEANNRTTAEEYARSISIENKQLVFYSYNEDSQTGNENAANTNLVYNADTKIASVSVVFSDDKEFNKSWKICTPKADLILYDIEPMPELSLTSSVLSEQNININWDGNRLRELDSVSFMLTTDSAGDMSSEAFVLGNISTANEIGSGTISYAIPPDLPSGTYYVKAVYTKEDIINEMVISSKPITWSNSNQPNAPSAVTAKNGGDYMLDVEVSGINTEDIDGYLLNIYEQDTGGNYILSAVNNVIFEKNSNNELPKLEAGGRFSVPILDENGKETSVKEVGLEHGKTYHVGIASFNNITLTNGEVIRVRSNEVRTSEPVVLNQPKKPDVQLTNRTNWQTLTRNQQVSDTETKEINVDTFAKKNVEFQVTSDVKVTGRWTLNDTLTGTFDTGDTIALSSLEDGDYKLQLSGEDNEGDGFALVKNFTVDTLPPVLMLTSPVNGAFFNQNGSIEFSGISDSDARFDIYVDGTLAADAKTVGELGGTIDSSGLFSFVIPGTAGASEQSVMISVKDAMQNASSAVSAKVYNKGFADVKNLTVYADGDTPQAGNLPLDENGLSATLTLGVNTSDGVFLLKDSSLVEWSVSTVLGNAEVDENGILSASAGSLGTVTGSFHVADVNRVAMSSGVIDSTVMKASVTFGAENQPKLEDQYILSLFAGIGGKVEGAGKYIVGEQVTLTAVPSNGYSFAGWKVLQGNITLADPSALTATFAMPTENVSVTAEFKQNNEISRGLGHIRVTQVEHAGEISANAGELCSFTLQQNTNGETYAPYYFEDGQKIYVCMSSDIDGKLWFVAPKNAVYYLEQRQIFFDDMDGHWAENTIYYSTSRNLFSGVSQTQFAPDEIMTRAMFVTVLQRLTGNSPPRASTAQFNDVGVNDWYFESVAWAAENNIISGYGNGQFGPNDPVTREQMCTIMLRYLNMSDYSLPVSAETTEFADSNAISDWAAEAISLCKRAGLVQGKGENKFEPQSNLTRAESCAVLQRLIESVLRKKGNL